MAKEKRSIVDVADLTYDLYLPWSHGIVPMTTVKLKKGVIFKARVEDPWRAKKAIKGYPDSQLTKDAVKSFCYNGKGLITSPPPKLIKKLPKRKIYTLPKRKLYTLPKDK